MNSLESDMGTDISHNIKFNTKLIILELLCVLLLEWSCPDIGSSRWREADQCSRPHQPAHGNRKMCLLLTVGHDCYYANKKLQDTTHHGNMHGVPVSLTVDGHCPDPQPPRRPHHTTSYLPSVRHQQLVKQLHISPSPSWSRGARSIATMGQSGRKSISLINYHVLVVYVGCFIGW